MRRLFFRCCCVVSLTMIILAGCTSKESTDNEPKAPEDNAPVVPEEKEEYPFPLTNEMTEQQDALNVRPVAVMVNNHPKARPQSGLHKADVVYEVLAEGEITRFLAIFQSEAPDVVGPVRSARDYFVGLAEGYGALYVAHGWSPEAKEMLSSGVIDNINGIAYDGTLFERASFRKAPHNSYITYDHILEGAEMNGYSMETETAPLPFITEDTINFSEGDKADEVTINYKDRNSVTYKYDATKEKYLRFNGDEETIDYDTETPIALDNVFIVETDHHVIDNAGRRDINLTSGGDAILLQKGTIQFVQWENDNGRIIPKGADGKVGFVSGQTWINIIPSDPGIEEDVIYETNE